MTRFLLPALLLAAAMVPARADDSPSIADTPHITVTGTAAAEVAPDTAEIRLGVTAREPTAAKAWDEDARLVKAMIDAAKAAGIKPQAIATTDVNLFQEVEEVRQPDGTSRSQPKGFRASHELRITTSELDKIGELTQTLIGKGANTFEGVSFSVARPEPLRDKLRGDAVRNARHQAEILAEAGGVRLGRLVQIERPEAPVAVQPRLRTSMAGPSTMQVEPGTQTLAVEVEVTYAIE